MARTRHRPRRRLTPALLLVLLIGLAVTVADRAGWLPEPIGRIVREIETAVLDPLLQELGVGSATDIPPPSPDRNPEFAELRTILARIRVEPEHRGGYQREDWPHWLDPDGNCLDAREEVLVAESLDPVRRSPDGCRVLAGRWLDRYTGEILTDPGTVDVDHFVPLQEAHDSGGHAWSRERRAAFANDVADLRTLIAVSAAANRAKGAKGPEDWMPPNRRYGCRYVADWIVVKDRWSLSMDERERMAVSNVLEACAEARLVVQGR